MRAYLIQKLILTTVILTAVSVFGQQPIPRPFGPCFYGCGPYIPLVTTPEISLQQFSPNPVGASNATTGLIAGATNSTLSQIEGSTSSVYTGAVWYQGGAPLIAPQVHLWPETVGREGHPTRDGMLGTMDDPRSRDEGPRGARPTATHFGEGHIRDNRSREERSQHPSEEARGDWTYFTGPATAASSFKKAAHAYGNDDVARQNDKNGAVKYDGKTEKM